MESLTLQFPTAGSYPEHLQARIETYLQELHFTDENGVRGLSDAMRYSLLAGGKRIRPVLSLATASALGTELEAVMPLAAAIELIHTYSLIHDDLPAMDDDDLRRGQPTAHRRYDEATAILAGDGLYAEAFALVLAADTADPAATLRAVRELAKATGVSGMVGGQYLDVCASSSDPIKSANTNDVATANTATVSTDTAIELRRVHELKTGRLIRASIECVLLWSGSSDEQLTLYRKFAGELGVLFQIVDDILDVTANDADLGKPAGSDLRHGRRTYVSFYGLERARELASKSHTQARELLALAAPDGAKELEQITDFIFTRTS